MTIDDIKSHVDAIILAGGSGTRLYPLSNIHCAKQFCPMDSENTFIQATIKRFYKLGITPNHIIVVTSNNQQTELAKQQLEPLGVISPNIYQISSDYGYAGSMVKAAEFVYEQDPDAIIVNTPSDQYIGANNFDSFIDSLKLAIRTAENDIPTIVGVKIGDLNTFVGCGHAIYDTQSNDFCRKVLDFVEKPDKKTAERMMRENNSVCNTGINVWKAKTILEATEHINLEETPIDTSDLMALFGELRVAIGEFDWHDCGTLKSLWEVSAKTSDDHNASPGKGYVDCTDCFGSMFIAPEGVEIYASDIHNSSVVVTQIDELMYIACVAHDECQMVRQLADHYQTNEDILRNEYSVKARNCRVERTNFSDKIRVSFVGMDDISVSAIKSRDKVIRIAVSRRASSGKY